VFVGDRANAHAAEPDDGMADGFTHAADLAVAAFADHDREHGLVAAGAFDHLLHTDIRRRRPAAVDHDARRQSLERVAIGHAEHPHLVLPFHFVARVHEPFGQFAVAREEQ
jgi:hypothetical protein